MKNDFFDVALCTSVETDKRFTGTRYIHIMAMIALTVEALITSGTWVSF
jgi:hypothetical protein